VGLFQQPVKIRAYSFRQALRVAGHLALAWRKMGKTELFIYAGHTALDAIQLACAAHARVDLFITNDERLSTKSIPHIHLVSSLQRAFL
jgi:hypothetical protein